MTKPTTESLCTIKTFFLLFLFISTSAQADSLWQTQSSQYLQKLLESKSEQLPELNEAAVRALYLNRQHSPLWSNADGLLDRAYDLLHVIIHAEDEGLNPADYPIDEIKKYWDSNVVRDTVYLDLLLTAALFRYSNHVYSGRFDPHKLDVNWHLENKALDMHRLFTGVASNASITQLLQQLPPQHSGYQLLKKALKRFREFDRQGSCQKFKPGPILESGVQHKQVLQLRQRLEDSGDLVDGAIHDIDIFDRELTEAVKRYQQRHGLKADGKVGPKTRRVLNMTLAERINKIRINMERWRWLRRNLGDRYLMVNMTGFELYLMENGSSVLSMPVIIGKSYRSTPSFSGLLTTMEYNPYWIIPVSISIEDMIPRQKRDPSYFAKKSIRMYRGWENAREIDPRTVNLRRLDKEHFPYWLRQDPGPKNALGRVKFLFSNPYDIYLHGTPDKYLFDRPVRTFSSGCIRVRDPVRLAAYLLNDGSLQMEEDILANIHLGSNQKVRLPIAVPIYLVYWTAWADQDGRVNFRNDVYGRDELLNNAFDSL